MLRGEELSSAYASADIFMMPSETETLGFVALEAMASGLAVVAVAAGGLVDIIKKPGITGHRPACLLLRAGSGACPAGRSCWSVRNTKTRRGITAGPTSLADQMAGSTWISRPHPVHPSSSDLSHSQNGGHMICYMAVAVPSAAAPACSRGQGAAVNSCMGQPQAMHPKQRAAPSFHRHRSSGAEEAKLKPCMQTTCTDTARRHLGQRPHPEQPQPL